MSIVRQMPKHARGRQNGYGPWNEWGRPDPTPLPPLSLYVDGPGCGSHLNPECLCDVVIPNEECPLGQDPERALMELEESFECSLGLEQRLAAELERTDQSVVRTIQEWLAKGWSLEEVASSLGVTIEAIADLLSTPLMTTEKLLITDNLVRTGEVSSTTALSEELDITLKQAERLLSRLHLLVKGPNHSDSVIKSVLGLRTQGYTYKAIGEVLRIPWSTARSICARAKAAA